MPWPDRTQGPAGAAAAGALAAYWLPGLAIPVRSLRRPLGIRDRARDDQGVALTFDDGPHSQGTSAVLDVLGESGACATFFLVGEQVERKPALAREIVAAGHEVGLHCYRHRNALRLTPMQVRDDIHRGLAAISEATGELPRLYRPPYGAITVASLVLGRRSRLIPLLWSCDGRDWRANATGDSIASRITSRLRAGDIVLLHDSDYYGARGSWRRTVTALPRVLGEVERRSLRLVSALPRYSEAEERTDD